MNTLNPYFSQITGGVRFKPNLVWGWVQCAHNAVIALKIQKNEKKIGLGLGLGFGLGLRLKVGLVLGIGLGLGFKLNLGLGFIVRDLVKG